ncbi:prepilin-type N-terminal cleavage/methylation domain-containing protein [Niallia sp. JL1B1071]|uniref:type IV pilus modification PilV family protein n=1 Tax=Niallia tiangongensis TaxID=3237105 RepID=UPI0037DC3250
MPFKRFIQNDKGISLIEILVSIVLLSILITSFLTFFPQVSSFNQKTDERLTSVTLAKNWLVQAQNNESILYKQLINLTENPSTSVNAGNLPLLTNINRNSDAIELIFKENNYFIHLYLYYREEILKGANTLYKIRIDVVDEQDKLNSNIYGYITKK